MKILWFLPPVLGRGGIETVTLHYAREFRKVGIDFVTVFSGPSLKDRSWEVQLGHVHIGPVYGILDRKFVLNWLGPLRRFYREVVASERPDVVVFNWAPLAIVLSKRKISMLSGKVVTKVVYEHGGWSQLNTSKVYRGAYRLGLQVSDHIICGGPDYAQALGRALKLRHVSSIGVPIELPSETIPRGTSCRVVFVGRVQREQKRIDRLLDAIARLPQIASWTIQVVGDGDDLGWFQERVSQLGVSDRFTWTGWQSNPWEHIKEATFLAFPSAHEGFAMVMVEAMSHGIPVLSTDCDFGPRTIIREGVNGWLVPNNDSDFGNALHHIVLGEWPIPSPDRVRATVVEFDSERVAKRLQQRLSLPLQHKRSGPSLNL